MIFDVVIIGAGPAGLSTARALATSGLRIAIVEKQAESVLANPGFDGREIALTHRSVELLKAFGAWDRMPAAEISPLREARVWNGSSTYALGFSPDLRLDENLGYFAPNYLIRRSLYEAAREQDNLTLIDQTTVTNVDARPEVARVTLSDGRDIATRLVIAADTRFSEMRRRMGIGASMKDFGKVMMVSRMEHEKPHDQIATEWFDYGQTFAILPLNGNVSSAVITLPARETDRLMAMDPDAFSAEVTHRYRGRLGQMRLISTRHPYPLVSVYADRFVTTRFALVGDAAVGMHPVTAHGYNLGALSADALASAINRALARGQDFASPSVLEGYQRAHRIASRPVYMGTVATAMLFNDSRLPARLARDVALRIGNHLPLFRRSVVSNLMRTEQRRVALA